MDENKENKEVKVVETPKLETPIKPDVKPTGNIMATQDGRSRVAYGKNNKYELSVPRYKITGGNTPKVNKEVTLEVDGLLITGVVYSSKENHVVLKDTTTEGK